MPLKSIVYRSILCMTILYSVHRKKCAARKMDVELWHFSRNRLGCTVRNHTVCDSCLSAKRKNLWTWNDETWEENTFSHLGLIRGDCSTAGGPQVVGLPPGGQGQKPPQPCYAPLEKGLKKTKKNWQHTEGIFKRQVKEISHDDYCEASRSVIELRGMSALTIKHTL